MLKNVSILLLIALALYSCSDTTTNEMLEKKYRSTLAKDTVLTHFLLKAASDTIQNWINSDLDYTAGLRFNNWQVDSFFVINQFYNKAMGFRVERCLDQEKYDDIQLIYCEKREGKWFFFDGETMVIPRKNYQTDINNPLSLDLLSKIGRRELLNGYYGHLWFFPFFFWTKEQNFADPFWGSESQKISYITRKSRTRERFEGVEISQNYPNPFDSITEISLSAPPEVTQLSLEIVSKNGKLVRSIFLDQVDNHKIKLKAKDFESGEYIYSLTFFANHRQYTQGYKRMIVSKKR